MVEEASPSPERETVLITGAFRFPEGDAAAARVLAIGRALEEVGFNVYFGGWEERSRTEDQCPDGTHCFKGFRYTSLNQFRTKKLNPALRTIRFMGMGLSAILWISRFSKNNKPSSIITYHGGFLYLLCLQLFCKYRGIRLVVDCTEWYDSTHLPGGKYGIAAIDSELRMRVAIPRIGRVIAISEFLSNYYSKRGCRVISLPPMIDIRDTKWVHHLATNPDRHSLSLVYAGVPGKKDLLLELLQSIETLRLEGKRIFLHLIGPSRENLDEITATDTRITQSLHEFIIFHGRVAQSQVPSLLAQCDFSVLFRPNQKSSVAGFSTKFVESLGAGVPIIANDLGDLSKFVVSGREAILCPSPSVADIRLALIQALECKRNTPLYQEMRNAARKCAIDFFHYQNHSNLLKAFFDE